MKLKLVSLFAISLLAVTACAVSCPQCGYQMRSDDNFCAQCLRKRNNWGDQMTYGGTPLMLTTVASGPGLGIFGNPLIRVYGFDLGLVSATEEVYGVSIAGGNLATEVYGLKIGALVFNQVIYGVQIGGLIFGDAGSILNGLQVGVLNWSGYVTGVQIGVVNIAKTMTGVQIGMFNYIEDSKVPFFPIVNFRF